MTHPSLSPQPGIWGNLLGLRGRVVRICVREVSLTLVSFTHLILVWMYVAPPMRMGAWSMALVLRQRIEYYIYIAHTNIGAKMRKIKIENSYRQKKTCNECSTGLLDSIPSPAVGLRAPGPTSATLSTDKLVQT